MNIGQASRETGISIKMLRYYEHIGLIPSVARSKAGYRSYTSQDIHRLRFIRRARDLGFSTDHIMALLRLWQDHHHQNTHVRHIALQHIHDLKTRISQMKGLVNTLQHLVDECSQETRSECPILNELEHPHRH